MLKNLFELWPLMMPDGGGDAGGGEGAAAAEGPTAAQGNEGQAKYGTDEADEGQPEVAEKPKSEPEKAKRLSYDELLKSDPEYAKEAQRRIDNAINRRFAKSKAAEEQNSKLMPALNLLSTRYGTEAGNVDALIEAINNDSDLIEQQAMDAGMEPEAYREFQRLKAENEAFKKAEEERQRQTQINNQMQQWRAQEEQAKMVFPSLDLAAEVQNEQFSQLLGAGIDVLTAYKAVHMDEINRGLIQNAAADAQRETIAKIQQKQNRPREGAAGKTQAATVKTDISKFSIKDFEDYMRRSARGEIIKF